MSNSPQPGVKAPKTMSSRLLTMKFMQRAAASPTKSSPSSPGSQSPRSDAQNQDMSTPPSAKRSKLSHDPGRMGTLGSPAPTSPSDVRVALLSAEATRQAALERSWSGQETKWSFAVRADGQEQAEDGLRVEFLNGRSVDDEKQMDNHAAIWRTEGGQGRMVFGNKRKHISTEVKAADEDDDDSSDSDDSEDSFDLEVKEILNTPDQTLPDRTDKAYRRPNRISGGVQNLDRVQCHGCGEFGHLMRDCPGKGQKRYHQPIGGRRTG